MKKAFSLVKSMWLASLSACVITITSPAHGQSVNYAFSSGTSDGWAHAGFSGSPVASVSNIGGQNYIYLPLGGFQVGNVASDSPGNLANFNAAMAAAAANPAGYNISYDWYVDTAGFSSATFFQLGSYVNSGSGYYAQDFGAVKEVELNGAQLASGQVFSGHVSFSLASVGFAIPPADTYFRLGLIENGDGTGVGAYFRNISVAPVPEPTALSLLGLGSAALLAFRRRKI